MTSPNHDLLPSLRSRHYNLGFEIKEMEGHIRALELHQARLIAAREATAQAIVENDFYHPPKRPNY